MCSADVVLVCWIFMCWIFSPKLHFSLSVLTVRGSDEKGDVDLLCCIFLLSCKVENKCERCYFFSAGFSGFILQKCFSLFIFD